MLEEVIGIIRDATANDTYRGKLFLVGGLLRDRALRIVPDEDVDIVCLTDALETAEYLNAKGLTDHAPVVYPRFGTAMVTIKGVTVEFATARRESYDRHSRKPMIEPATLEEDVLRRDFTVNTLLEDLHSAQVLDLTGRAFTDLDLRLIRTPLDPVVTFQDDPLRMLRAVRFAAKLDFQIEESAYQAILKCADRLDIISGERIRDELSKMLLMPKASRGLEMLKGSGLLDGFAPELTAMSDVQQNVFHLYDVWTHTMKALDNLPSEAGLSVRLGVLFHDIGKPLTRTEDEDGSVHFYSHQSVGADMTRDILHRLKYPNSIISEVGNLVARHMRIGEYNERWSDTAVRRLVRDLGEQMDELFILSEADKAACNPEYHYLDSSVVRHRIESVQKRADYRQVESPLDGNEIMRVADIPPGPLVGHYKDMLINEILEGRLEPKDKLEAERILRCTLEGNSGEES